MPTFWQFRRLPRERRGKFQDAARILIAEKNWEGCAGQEITDEIRVTIAGQASLLLLGLQAYFFDGVRSILVYPSSFLVWDRLGHRRFLLGMMHEEGAVALSWWDAEREGTKPREGRSLVLHEFAHVLGLLDAHASRVPLIHDRRKRKEWEEIMTAEFHDLEGRPETHKPSVLQVYGAENESEFFAVATECFFQKPRELEGERPRLYRALSDWYGQDPVREWKLDAGRSRRPAEKRPALREEHGSDEETAQRLHEYSEAIARHPDLVEAYERRALLYRCTGEYDRAIADHDVAIRLQPGSPELHCSRGCKYLRMGAYERAILDFQRAINLSPDFAEAYGFLGMGYERKGALDKAIQFCRQAIRIDPSYQEAYHGRGVAHAKKGDFKRSLLDLSAAIRLDPEAPLAYSDRVFTRIQKSEVDEAIADCNKAIELDPGIPEPFNNRALALSRKGDFKGAVEDLNRALALDPKYVEALRARAEAYRGLGLEEQAAEGDRAANASEEGGKQGAPPRISAGGQN